ncbi:MAG: Sir2 silent information regulator family NAD-dependent deacetylase [Firmicutes bacterium]|nr:Sir2 silent information regulator family NAD-dependent deacetylase [Bacillota bacterium]
MKADIKQLKKKIYESQAVVIGAGSGLSTAAGFTYGGNRFQKYFSDFEQAYGFHDMYSGVFYPFQTLNEYWGFMSRLVYINRYMPTPNQTYGKLFQLIQDKDYFVLTTNVDHCFQRSGFDKNRLFYTQGDYGLFQCSKPCHHDTYDNKNEIEKMLVSLGFLSEKGTQPDLNKKSSWKLVVPDELIPRCPLCGEPMSMNLRGDETFVEDSGWYAASGRYSEFLHNHRNDNILFLELGVGMNTPGIIKYPFWRMSLTWPNAYYICVNQGQAVVPKDLQSKSLCINGDIDMLFVG